MGEHLSPYNKRLRDGKGKVKRCRRSKERDEKFLDKLREGFNPIDAASMVGYAPSTVYYWRRNEPDFRDRWEEAYQFGLEVRTRILEAEADRRAVEGFAKPVYQKGELVGYEQVYSDSLLMFRLKRLDKQYVDRVDLNHSGEIDNPSGAATVNVFLTADDDSDQSDAT